jgi:hypothetical protein
MNRRKTVGAALVGLVVLGGGAAVAATQLDSPTVRSQAIISDAAGQLGVSPDKLSSALQKALEDQLQADVTAGRLTQAQADAAKQRIESGDYPLVGTGGGFGGHFGHGGRGFGFGGFGMFGDLSTAATYLGVTTDQLRTDLQSGKTLAQAATDQGKTADGLTGALVAAATTKLDAAVTAGKLTSTQESAIVSNLQKQITDFVNGTRPTFGTGKTGAPFSGGPFFPGGGPGGPSHSFRFGQGGPPTPNAA